MAQSDLLLPGLAVLIAIIGAVVAYTLIGGSSKQMSLRNAKNNKLTSAIRVPAHSETRRLPRIHAKGEELNIPQCRHIQIQPTKAQ